MAGGDGEASAAPLLAGATTTERYREGCPGCWLAEANEGKTGVPRLSFLYIWVVCLVAACIILASLECGRSLKKRQLQRISQRIKELTVVAACLASQNGLE
ncbi:protein ZINC INDUCED FACILITATOR-LIKE 1-like isoform X1 [Panicum miliaceum]|uniref:Protein ZINC INDUCED FACILITATOR-LIKE 1-like isoform X1 n=1 Tax=Panicum miliaceum TaxID=4540 RepID=A0A3L6R269_PANMI|nr:protein ZINC INDUCED FACILITATOR-LIKE 1-like isoform X1 [Panicum miliaceum]